MTKSMPRASPRLLPLSEDYFSFLARCMPVCCMSDEFHFMPRVESARFHMEQTDRLEKDFLGEVCAKVKDWKAKLWTLGDEEDPGLVAMLKQSMDSFLVHWETLGLWKRDPGLYLKVAFIGLDQALSWPWEDGTDKRACYRARLDAIVRLLAWGMDQLDGVPEPAREAALDMVGTCRAFLSGVARETGQHPGASGRERAEKERLAFEALDRFQEFLMKQRGAAGFHLDAELFQEVLGRGFGWTGLAEEARDILGREIAEKNLALAELARTIDPGQEWRTVYDRTGLPDQAYYKDPVSLYREEVQRLEAFFGRQEILPMPPSGSVRVEPTPPYMQPIRATASYSAPPILVEPPGQGRFFVQALSPEGSCGEGRKRLESVHREYRYLAAHETYPGHHALDWARLSQTDPIRRRIESALFYEGWACYAEQLVDELGYSQDPRQRLIRIRRDLWRAVRGEIDLGLHTDNLSLEQGAERLEGLGYAREDARKQARRITLTPGYQLCYTLGKNRFLLLRKRRVPPLSLKDFHAVVFSLGQVPFSYLEQALDSPGYRTER